MRLFNTMSQAKEEFTAGPLVTLYVCGVTPYDTTHLGHAFSYATFDVLIRFLNYLGHEVRYTQNVTDIDDDILRKAKELGVRWDDLGREQTDRYVADMAALNILPPTHYPRATQEISGMIDIISTLLERGHAYAVGTNVYFSSNSAEGFGRLARLSRGEMLERFAQTGDSPDNPEKRDSLDFILWKKSAEDEPYWDSPWGPGRPGWHIECTAMATHYLGPKIDIHGGGDDLIFPHHSCEIVQSVSATGQEPFARLWMHNAPVRLDGVKMSKSLGNLVMARELLERYPANAIRLYLLRHHYRTAFDYDEVEMRQAAADEEVIAAAVRRHGAAAADLSGDDVPDVVRQARRTFVSALADDLNTPVVEKALGSLAQTNTPEAAAALVDLGAIVGLRY